MNPLCTGDILSPADGGGRDLSPALDGRALMHRIGNLEAENLRLQELVAEVLLKNQELRNNSAGS